MKEDKVTTSTVMLNDTNWYNNLSMCSIWNVLLRNIHFVEDYQTDLLYGIESVQLALACRDNWDRCKNVKGDTGVWWFGYRDSGVDHLEYIYSSVINEGLVRSVRENSYYKYRKLFKLTITKDDDKAKMTATLEDCSLYDFFSFYRDTGIFKTRKGE